MKFRLPVLLFYPLVAGLMICSLLSGGSVSAQGSTPATVTGVLNDLSGRPIAGAHIVVTATGASPSSQQTTEAQSRDDGTFTLTLAPGDYKLVITQKSFTRMERELNLTAGQQLELKLQLEIQPLSAAVVVTGGAMPEAATSTPAPVDVITREEIDQRALDSLPNLLATMPGFSLSQTGPEGGLATLFLDGGNSNYTRVYLDGVPLNNSGGIVDFSNYTLDNIDKIEVVHGAESALYGSDAMTGVIQMFTHRGDTRTPELDLEGDGGSFDTGQGSAVLSGLLGRFDYSLGNTYFSTNGQGPNDFFFNRTNSGSFGWKFSKTNTLRLVVRNNTSDGGAAGQILFPPPLGPPPDLNQDNSQHDFSAGLSWDAQAGEHWHWHVTANEADLRDLDTDTTPMAGFVSTDVFNRAGFTGQASYLMHDATVTGGYEYEVENGFPSALDGEHARRNNMAGYLDARWQATKRLTVNAGTRAEDNSSFGTRVVPRVGGAYLLSAGKGKLGDTRLHAFYGQGIDEPELAESFGTDPCFPGNPTLSPEESRTVNAGIDQGFGFSHLHVSADYFDNEFHNLISFAFMYPPPPSLAETCPFGTGTYFNTDLARARGVNLSGEMRPAKWLQLSGHYSYDDSRVLVSPNASVVTEMPGNHLLRRPVNSGSIVANIPVWRFNGNIVGYFSGRATDNDFLGLLLPFRQEQDPGYARFDVAVSYRVQKRTTLFVRAENVLNRQYETALGYPALGREIRVGLKLRIGGE
jgi:vitamin B12 transporter